jgi:hypothetical protein
MATTTTSGRRGRARRGISWSHGVAFLLGCCVSTMLLTMFHGSLLHDLQDVEQHFADKHHLSLPQQVQVQEHQHEHIALPDEHQQQQEHHHDVAGLDCSAHGGPDQEESSAAQEMVYWKDLPLDNEFVSPFRSSTERRQYLTFEPDGGGWNNIRMSMETVLGMAIATGRVLVLPPSQKMYLLGKDTFSFADFFPLPAISKEHAGLEIITMKQFLQESFGTLRVKDNNGPIAYPPLNKTDWDGDTDGVKAHLNPWLQTTAYNPDWNPDKCFAGTYCILCLYIFMHMDM